MLSKEKEESIKENQSLARQLDDLRQGSLFFLFLV